MTLSSIPVSPCRFLPLFVTGILCSIAPFLTNAHRQEAPADRIAMDLIKVTDQDQNASFDCWISAVESLLLDERTEPMTSPSHGSDSSYSCCHQQQSSHISPGTSFCSALSNPQKKVLALQLTQCYLEESNRVIFLPESCQIENILLDDDNNGSRRTSTSSSKNTKIRSCLFDLSSEGFLVYTQFYLLADLACMKLTSELVIRRKLEAVAKFQEAALMMEEQVERVFVLQQGIIMDMKEQKDLLERKRVIIQSMNMDIDVARQKMISFKSFVEEQETSMLLLLKEMYDRGKLKEIWKSFQQMCHSLDEYDGSYLSFVMRRFLLLLSLPFFTMLVFPIRRRCAMRLIFVLTLVDVVIESMARHYLELGIFNNANLHEFLTSQRQKRMDVLVYLVVALLSLLWNSISSSSNKTKDLASTNSTITGNGPTAAVITKQDIQDILSSIELRRMETKQHHEELRQHLVSLQRQLFPCTLETMPPSRRTAEKVVPQPSSVQGQHTSTSNMNAPSSIQGTRFATPITADVEDSNSSDHDEDDHRSITIVSSDKMPIVTPSINLPSRLATRKSCHEQQQQQQHAPIGITIPTSVESPLASPMQSSMLVERKHNHFFLKQSAVKLPRHEKHKRKHDCDSDNESSQQSSKRQKNNYDSDNDEDDDYNDNSDSSNHYNGNNHDDA